jgi:hypothetical protein
MSLESGVALAVARWAAWAPGLADRASWQDWAAGRKEISGPVDPDVSFVKPLLRRRLSPLNRMAFHVASACLPDGEPPFCIFCSRYGEYRRAFEILNALDGAEPVSPNAFSLSVHNTVSSLFSIARGDGTHSTALAAGATTLEAGFLEARGLLAESPGRSALLVYYDEPLPSLYAERADPVETSAALALLLKLPERAEASDMVLKLSWCGSEGGQSAPAAPQHPVLRLAKLLLGVERRDDIADGRLAWSWSRHDAAA